MGGGSKDSKRIRINRFPRTGTSISATRNVRINAAVTKFPDREGVKSSTPFWVWIAHVETPRLHDRAGTWGPVHFAVPPSPMECV
jgi:hypothetical protein